MPTKDEKKKLEKIKEIQSTDSPPQLTYNICKITIVAIVFTLSTHCAIVLYGLLFADHIHFIKIHLNGGQCAGQW